MILLPWLPEEEFQRIFFPDWKFLWNRFYFNNIYMLVTIMMMIVMLKINMLAMMTMIRMFIPLMRSNSGSLVVKYSNQ